MVKLNNNNNNKNQQDDMIVNMDNMVVQLDNNNKIYMIVKLGLVVVADPSYALSEARE